MWFIELLEGIWIGMSKVRSNKFTICTHILTHQHSEINSTRYYSTKLRFFHPQATEGLKIEQMSEVQAEVQPQQNFETLNSV